jgi:hypothetical protein
MANGRGVQEPPTEVLITVLWDARTLRERIPWLDRPRAGAALALLLAASAASALIALGPPGGGDGPAGSRTGGPAGVAAAYGYPLRCLSITISASDPAFARADPDRASPCGRYDGSMTAIFRRVHGAWRPVLDTSSYRCPVESVPPVAQGQLAVCP